MPAHSFADVDVYVEGAYTETDLVVYIYADIDGGTVLRSAGVKLTYSSSELTVVSAEKNEDDWYMGAGVQDPDKEYMDPDIETVGEVVIILGKLDTAAPLEGVSGDRVLLGKATFAGVGEEMPFTPSLGLTFAYGTGDPADSFKNFVDTEVPANVLDDDDDPVSINFGSMTVRERGDANADGNINVADYIAIRNILNSEDFPPYADCNDDGSVNVADYICVRNKL